MLYADLESYLLHIRSGGWKLLFASGTKLIIDTMDHAGGPGTTIAAHISHISESDLETKRRRLMKRGRKMLS
ncbi:hypothetical protein GN956_G25401 [Arapaima gigas]